MSINMLAKRYSVLIAILSCMPSCSHQKTFKDVESEFAIPDKAPPLKEANGFAWVALRFPVAMD